MFSSYGVIEFLFFLSIAVAAWMVFIKAGKPGWGALVPFYNFYLLLQIAGKPVYWVLLLFVPVVNIFIVAATHFALAERFGQSRAFGWGLVFLPHIFYMIIGYGDAEYQGDDDLNFSQYNQNIK